MATILDHHDRKYGLGQPPTAEIRFTVREATSDTDATNAAWNYADETLDLYGDGNCILTREHIALEPLTETDWAAVVSYGAHRMPLITFGTPTPTQVSESFDTTGGTYKALFSIATTESEAVGGPGATNFENAIGVDGEGKAEGVDITCPVLQISRTLTVAAALVTQEYVQLLYALTGNVNSEPFHGYAAGEVLFLGATGSTRGDGQWEIAYKFAMSPNVSNLAIGELVITLKLGWEYIWVQFGPKKDPTSKGVAHVPRYAYVEQVYKYSDLNALGI